MEYHYGTTVVPSLARRFDKLQFDMSYVREGRTYTVTTAAGPIVPVQPATLVLSSSLTPLNP